MPRYKLRTLLILLAILPPMLAGMWLYPRTTMYLGLYALLTIYLLQIAKPMRFVRRLGLPPHVPFLNPRRAVADRGGGRLSRLVAGPQVDHSSGARLHTPNTVDEARFIPESGRPSIKTGRVHLITHQRRPLQSAPPLIILAGMR